MAKKRIRYSDHFEAVTEALTSRGLLLGSYDAARKANVMTIGWGAMGSIWGEPLWIVLVRPSRHTFSCVEHTGCFTVNVPTKKMAPICAQCGSTSGRDLAKFNECGLTEEQASSVLAPAVGQCPIHYECEVVHRNDVQPEKLAAEIITGSYTDGDFHRVYFGKIIAAYGTDDAAKQLA